LKFKEFKKRVQEELKPFFYPKGIAVIGASRKEYSAGHVIFKLLLENHRKGLLKGKVFGVNIKGGSIFGEKLYKTIEEIPHEVDHAVIVIPADLVPSAMYMCGKKGVKVATIITGGFSEVGRNYLEEEVIRIANKYNIRIIGPNGVGIFDAYSGVDTLFLPTKKEVEGTLEISLPRPPPGFISFLSQSGALGSAVIDYMYGENLGLAKFISWGNKIDVNEAEMLAYLADDEYTRVILMYIEAFKKNGKFVIEIGKEVSKRKPIVVLKGGMTEAGARGTLSHTASMAGNVKLYEVAFKEMGGLLADNLIEFLDMAKALSMQPPARGPNIGIVTNGGGPGILASDYAEKMGFKVPKFSQDTIKELQGYVESGIIPKIATFSNPIDLSGTATDDSYAYATEALLRAKEIDAVIVLALHHPPTVTDAMPKKLINIIKDYHKPVIAIDVGSIGVSLWVRKMFDNSSIPAYPLPVRAIYGMKALIQYGSWLRKNGVLEQYLESWKPPKMTGGI